MNDKLLIEQAWLYQLRLKLFTADEGSVEELVLITAILETKREIERLGGQIESTN